MANPFEGQSLGAEGRSAAPSCPGLERSGDRVRGKGAATDLDQSSGDDPDHVVEKAASLHLYAKAILTRLVDPALVEFPHRGLSPMTRLCEGGEVVAAASIWFANLPRGVVGTVPIPR